MGLYNFQRRFVEYIELGLHHPGHLNGKLHTIRARRKHEDKPGDTMHLYVGLRQRGARLIARVECVAVRDILIDPHGVVTIDGHYLTYSECDELARHDGFPGGAEEMRKFWQEYHFRKEPGAFEGRIYHWMGAR